MNRLITVMLAIPPLALSLGCATTQDGPPKDIHAEVDPNATKTVTPVDLKGKAPDNYEVRGDFAKAFAWTDKYGLNAVVISTEASTDGDATTSMLIANMVLWEGGAWTSQRVFRERIERCRFDTELTVFTDAWSITDHDNNGLAEATFAYRAGCRSDVSPVTHKVLMAQHDSNGGGVKKYALRGITALDAGAGVEGGTYKADVAFKNAPPSFLNHAKMVWTKTSLEKM